MVTPVQNMGPTMVPQPSDVQGAPTDQMAANMQEFAEQTGRGGDTILAHLTPGEIVIPIDIQTEEVLVAVRDAFAAADADPLEFVVGMAQNKINPQTGNPEFFFKKIKKKLKKVRDKVKKSKFLRIAIPMAASIFLPMLAPTMMANPLIAAGTNYTANRLVGNDHKSSLMGAAVAGVGTGVANKAAGSTFMGGSAPATTGMLGKEIAAKTAIGDLTVGQAGQNMFGAGVPGANTLSNIPTGSLGQASNAAMTNAATAGATSASGTLGNMSAGALTGAAGQASGSLATAGAQSALDAAKEQEALAAAALAKFNKPLPQLSEEELRQLVNDPLNRNVDGGIYNYAPV